ncbi:uncharacterized protein LOC124276373 [Haliotis rubra]|uniref:uncharacterized protein LOC124276373 n=1 Tax=Haliotis rubra TaxID=36100 RepID=UPI001EE53750|nr:uncharacterized protein LOC124276373 [Haliotis rubra]
MTAWRSRFHDKWPHLSNLNSSSEDLNAKEDKYFNPMLAYDNDVDYQELQGAYRFYYTPRNGDVVMPVPTYHSKKDGASTTDTSSDDSANRRSNRKVCAFVVLLFLLVGIIVSSIIVSVILTQKPSEPTPVARLQSSLRVTDKTYTSELADPSSPRFKAEATEFCNQMKGDISC